MLMCYDLPVKRKSAYNCNINFSDFVLKLIALNTNNANNYLKKFS